MLFLKQSGLTLYDTVIQRPGSNFHLFQCLILMVTVAERGEFQNFMGPN